MLEGLFYGLQQLVNRDMLKAHQPDGIQLHRQFASRDSDMKIVLEVGMNSIKFEDFANNILVLLEETFSSPQGYYLDRSSGGLMGTLENITAAQASSSFKPGMTTIAGHVDHTRFYLSEVVVQSLRGQEVGKLDWDQSWVLKTVNELEWQELKQNLSNTCQTVLEFVKARETWDDQPITDAMVGLAHTAYHVGAIRQMTLML
jgi:hypothetical protein